MALILPRLFGLYGVLYAAPAADFLSALLVTVFITVELRRLGKNELHALPLVQIQNAE
jgi:hypothetical protein